MIESTDPKNLEKPSVRCEKCDTEVTHYNVFIEANNDAVNICWQCLQRTEKGFFTKRDFSRRGRGGLIPR